MQFILKTWKMQPTELTDLFNTAFFPQQCKSELLTLYIL